MNVLRTFRRHAAEALADSELHGNVRRSTGTTLAKRAKLIATDPDFAAARERVSEIRSESVARRHELLAQATEHLTRAGVQVHRAANAADARRIVGEIADACRAKLVVKGKSMLSEEIDLTPFLGARGLEVLETDLGEFIVQLLEQPPSHITAPALHLNRRQVGRVFADKLGLPYSEVPEELTELARRHLREKFLAADLGISGGNFVVAESGTLVLVENEGNIGLTSTLPRVHVALTGIEKLLPRLSDLPPLLRVLPVNATGQRATAYVSLLNGPAPAASPGEQRHGPEEMHVIFLDNGRELLARGAHAEILQCVRCGSCLNVCPIFRHIGGHAYGSVYPSAMGLLLSPWLLPHSHAGSKAWRGAAIAGAGHHPGNSLADVCALCGACGEACPAKIDLPDLILRAREDKEETGPLARQLGFRLFAAACDRPALFRALGAVLRASLRRLPGSWLRVAVPAWCRDRAVPPAPRQSCSTMLRQEFPEREFSAGASVGRKPCGQVQPASSRDDDTANDEGSAG